MSLRYVQPSVGAYRRAEWNANGPVYSDFFIFIHFTFNHTYDRRESLQEKSGARL